MMRVPHGLVALGMVLLLTAAAAAQEEASNPALERYFSQSLTNLQVIPEDTPRSEVIDVMRGFLGALNVGCNYCHVGAQRGCPPTPEGISTCDFATDIMPAKQAARDMMRMTAEINARVPAAVMKSANDATRVQCVTCHRGVEDPQQLSGILSQTASDKSMPAAIEEFRDLRKRYYGGQSYDFRENSLIALARSSIEANKSDEALSWLQLNLEYYPNSAASYRWMAEAYEHKNDRDTAIKSVEKALELDPDNGAAKRLLDRLETP